MKKTSGRCRSRLGSALDWTGLDWTRNTAWVFHLNDRVEEEQHNPSQATHSQNIYTVSQSFSHTSAKWPFTPDSHRTEQAAHESGVFTSRVIPIVCTCTCPGRIWWTVKCSLQCSRCRRPTLSHLKKEARKEVWLRLSKGLRCERDLNYVM